MPSVAVRELRRVPVGLLDDICEMRAYAKAKQLYEQAQHWDDSPQKRKVMSDPLVQMVMQHEFAPLLERQRKQDDGR